MSLFLCIATAMAQGKSISGVVLDATNHEPVIGASVLVKGVPGQGASTDINGKFTLKTSRRVLSSSYPPSGTLRRKSLSVTRPS